MERISHTTSAKLARRLNDMHGKGTYALGKVLNLVAVVRDDDGVRAVSESAIGVAEAHPLRVIVVLPDASDDGAARLDADIMNPDDVGLAEVVILRPYNGAGTNRVSLVTPLLLPDAPVFTWWVQEAPQCPTDKSLGQIASRRITNANASDNPLRTLRELAQKREPGDTDISWAGITIWRSQLAALLNEAPHEEVLSATVGGNLHRVGANMLAAWLRLRLGVEVDLVHTEARGIEYVILERASGALSIKRPSNADIAILSRPGRADLQISMPMRTLQAQLIEELRTVGDDSEFAAMLAAIG
ncbi:glucose-6-phosphate dehydrogenase assembly protein OpcA [Trueperella pyogenes]|uniref:glucose-6-phosphate dehydrogenase assembly protein OpcA n=1 Tax=Trueperella pyogenes TaxID=1661 RepID=UPI000D25C0BA|nr:glucose-6-phosphate dehydrogenase assembly protein OpcA [Trueperella pyogenes]AWA42612.1 glucose-6-phosphate dehydrogenase [Trueperella pyogenes]AZR00424.1 glucose-6-phosphate dehydrogenase [Trueperella pyogenes]MDF2420192.1 glucose-6-phosphate dehydrogenase assembly protein OpcA [Trueperella pyogenes]UVJ52845.1 glucose-6-phosphate dehydrogenase assembly protein OpcA [Trueperella pyogenes]UVJ54813.1 glucose-6-phosphate dehydrogenase assembly protein OpcA [Trueperella pyogenes]